MNNISSSAEARKLLNRVGVADCHCDTVGRFSDSREIYDFKSLNETGHIDLPRLQAGKVRVQFFAICVPKLCGSLKETLKYIELYFQNMELCKDKMGHVNCFSDLQLISDRGQIGGLLFLEGGEAIEDDILILHLLHRLGIRGASLTWNYRNRLADGVSEESTRGGLTRMGKEVIKTMQSLGMILDLSHLSKRGFLHAINEVTKPPMVSHANSYALCPHPRNLNDIQLKKLARAGGLIGLSFYPRFISDKKSEVSLDDLLDHFVHIVSLIGAEHLCLGSDFDGINGTVKELYDCSCYPLLVEGMLKRGFSTGEVEMIVSGNVMRFLKETLKP